MDMTHAMQIEQFNWFFKKGPVKYQKNESGQIKLTFEDRGNPDTPYHETKWMEEKEACKILSFYMMGYYQKRYWEE